MAILQTIYNCRDSPTSTWLWVRFGYSKTAKRHTKTLPSIRFTPKKPVRLKRRSQPTSEIFFSWFLTISWGLSLRKRISKPQSRTSSRFFKTFLTRSSISRRWKRYRMRISRGSSWKHKYFKLSVRVTTQKAYTICWYISITTKNTWIFPPWRPLILASIWLFVKKFFSKVRKTIKTTSL